MTHYLVVDDFNPATIKALFPNATPASNSNLVQSTQDYLEDKLANGWEFVGLGPDVSDASAIFRSVAR